MCRRRKKKSESCDILVTLQNTKQFFENNRIHIHKRLKHLRNRVVSGTENIVRLFQDRVIQYPSKDPNLTTNYIEKEKTSEDDVNSKNSYTHPRDVEEGFVMIPDSPWKEKLKKSPDRRNYLMILFIIVLLIIGLYTLFVS